MIEWNDERLERYSRNILLGDVGIEGQEKLLRGSVLVIGAGGLGAPAAYYLAAAGVGKIGVVDSDDVELSNLQRQIIHSTPDIGRPKAVSASEKMRALNPDIEVAVHHTRFTAENAASLLEGYDFAIDGTDNFGAKFLINDACFFAGVPYSHAGILRFDGQALTVKPRESACLRCVFRKPPPPDAVPTCAQSGVIGGVAGLLGTIQALEAIRFLLGKGKLLTDRFLVINALDMKTREVKLKRSADCPLCGPSPEIVELKEETQYVCELKR